MIKSLLRLLGLYAFVAAIPDASTVVQKWQQRASAAASDYAAGVQNTDKDPTALAIAAIPRMQARFNDAVNSGKVANGLRRVGAQGWKQAVANKGVQNFQSGIAAATDKATAAFTRLLSFEQQVQNEINSMPNATDADREQRMLRWVRRMREYTG